DVRDLAPASGRPGLEACCSRSPPRRDGRAARLTARSGSRAHGPAGHAASLHAFTSERRALGPPQALPEECSSMARAPVSKTGGWGFESLHSCQAPLSRRHLVRLGAGLASLSLALPAAEREAWSQVPKTIRFIVPFPAGGGADLVVTVLS